MPNGNRKPNQKIPNRFEIISGRFGGEGLCHQTDHFKLGGIDTVEDEAVLNKVFGFFDGKHGFVERILEAANLLGVSIDEDAIEKLRDQCNRSVAEVHKGVDRAVGIACFAQRWNNILMWSHYANKHTGICVEYDFDIPFETAPNSLLLPVEYTSMRPLLPIEKLGAIRDGDFEVNDANIKLDYSRQAQRAYPNAKLHIIEGGALGFSKKHDAIAIAHLRRFLR